jgi:hypothetical protein
MVFIFTVELWELAGCAILVVFLVSYLREIAGLPA